MIPNEGLRAAVRDAFGDVDLNPTGEAMFSAVERHAPLVAQSVLDRVSKLKGKPRSLGPIWADIAVAYLAASRDVKVHPEPVIDAAGHLQIRAAAQGEKRSDFAFWIRGPRERPVNVETKNPEPDDVRQSRIFDEIRARITTLRQKGEARATVDIHALSGFLSFPGGELGRMVKAIVKEIKAVTQGPAPTDWSFPRRTVTYNGVPVAEVGRGPGEGAVTTSPGTFGASASYPVEDLVDRGQLARDVPNVVVVYLHGELTPLPPTIGNGFRNAFSNGRLRRVSAGLVYASPEGRELVMNPDAEIPLDACEAEFFLLDHVPPV